MDYDEIERKAIEEIDNEKFREAVAARKVEISSEKWWYKLIPFTISIKFNWRK